MQASCRSTFGTDRRRHELASSTTATVRRCWRCCSALWERIATPPRGGIPRSCCPVRNFPERRMFYTARSSCRPTSCSAADSARLESGEFRAIRPRGDCLDGAGQLHAISRHHYRLSGRNGWTSIPSVPQDPSRRCARAQSAARRPQPCAGLEFPAALAPAEMNTELARFQLTEADSAVGCARPVRSGTCWPRAPQDFVPPAMRALALSPDTQCPAAAAPGVPGAVMLAPKVEARLCALQLQRHHNVLEDRHRSGFHGRPAAHRAMRDDARMPP